MEILSRPTAKSAMRTEPSSPSISGDAEGDRCADDVISRSNSELRNLMEGLHEHLRSVSMKEKRELEEMWGLTYPEVDAYIKTVNDRSSTESRLSSSILGRLHMKKNAVRPCVEANENCDQRSGDVAVVPCTRPSLIRRTMNALNIGEDLDIFQKVLNDIVTTNGKVEEEYLKLKAMTPAERGIRLLVLFQRDLLTGISGEIAARKSVRGREMALKPVSKWAKVFGFTFLLLLNMALLLYILLFAINQDQYRQSAWVQSFIIWLIVEIFLVSSLVMVMSEFVVPSLVYSEVKKIKEKMIATVHDYESKMMDRKDAARKYVINGDSFNVAPVLFVSTRLAMKFPHLTESKIIKEFKTDIPKQAYQCNRADSSMNVYRSRLRLTAVMNSINLLFLFIISRLSSISLSSIERCFFDLIGWVGVGYFLFWQALLFRNNVIVAFFIYLALFSSLGTFLYYYFRSACRLRSRKRAGIISIKNIYEKKKKKEEKLVSADIPPAQLIVQNFVNALQKQGNSKYNPRYARILESLKKASVVQKSKSISDQGEEINYDVSSSSDEGEISLKLSRYVDAMADKSPAMAARIRSHKAKLHRIMQRRIDAPVMKDRLKMDLELNIDLSDCSDDSYVDEGEVDMYSLSSDSDDISEGSGYIEGAASSTDRKKKLLLDLGLSIELSDSSIDNDIDKKDSSCCLLSSDSGEEARNDSDTKIDKCGVDQQGIISFNDDKLRSIVSDLFIKPKTSRLRQRIDMHRPAIRKMQLKRRAQNIEESFLMNNQARRASILANQARAHKKLHKRIAQKREPITPGVNENDAEDKRELNKLSSFEVFNEKKSMVKNYTAHQSLLKHSLESRRRESKTALENKIRRRKVEESNEKTV